MWLMPQKEGKGEGGGNVRGGLKLKLLKELAKERAECCCESVIPIQSG